MRKTKTVWRPISHLCPLLLLLLLQPVESILPTLGQRVVEVVLLLLTPQLHLLGKVALKVMLLLQQLLHLVLWDQALTAEILLATQTESELAH